MSTEQIQAMCDEQGFVGWIETSAKENTNVETAMRYLIEHILALHIDSFEAPCQEQLIQVTNTAPPKPNSCCQV